MSEKIHPDHDNEVDHIQQSTLIPESHYSTAMDDPNDQVSVVPVSHAEASEATDKPMAAGLHKDPSFIKKNGGYIAVAAFATVALAVFAFKSSGNAPQTPPQIAQAPATVAPPTASTASTAVAVAPKAVTSNAGGTPVVAPIEINDASVPGSPAALQTPTAVVVQTGVPTTVAAPAPIAATTTMPTEVAVVAAPVVVASAAPGIDVARIDSQISSNTTVVDLKTRVERLENNRQNAFGQTSSASSETVASTEVKKAPVVSAAQRARQREVAAARQITRVSKDSKNVAVGGAESGYSVHIVRDNLAWVRSPNGMISSYSLGDAIPGLGKLSKINEHAHTVVAGNRVIK